MNRRAVLKALGIAPAALPAIAAQANSLAYAGVQIGGGTAAKLAQMGSLPTAPAVPEGGMRFTSFAKWLLDTGKEESIRREAAHIQFMDPDIASMHLPTNTKIIWQRERNYKALRAAFERRFDYALKKNGFVERWLD